MFALEIVAEAVSVVDLKKDEIKSYD